MTVRHEGNRTIIHRDPPTPTSDAEKLRERDRYVATMRLSLEAKDGTIEILKKRLRDFGVVI